MGDGGWSDGGWSDDLPEKVQMIFRLVQEEHGASPLEDCLKEVALRRLP